jgi:hypothetical protein
MNTQAPTTPEPIVFKNAVDDALTQNDQWRDPFIEELHQVRARLLAKANGDMHQLIVNAHQTAVSLGFAAR